MLVLSLLPVACGAPSGRPPAESGESSAGRPSPAPAAPETPDAARRVEVTARPGVAEDLALPPGTCHVLSVSLRAGEGLTFTLDQEGVDLFTTLEDPAGDEAITFDSPTLDRGTDAGAWIAEESGSHRLEICAAKGGGRYRLEAQYPLAPDTRLRERVDGFRDYDQGGRLVEAGDATAGREAFESALAHWRAAGDELAQAWASYRIGRILLTGRQPAAASEAFDDSAAAFAAAGDRRSEARTALWAGNAALGAGSSRGAIVAYRRARSAAQEVGSAAIERNAVEGLASSFTELNEPLDALELFGELLSDPRLEAGAEVRVRVLWREGLLYLGLGEAERALDLFDRARDLAEREGVRAKLGNVMLGLGGALLDLGRFEEAERALGRARRLLAEEEGWEDLGWATSRLGRLYLQTGRFPEARGMFDRALELARSRQDRVMAAEVLINRGRLAALERQHEMALADCRMALDDLTSAGRTLFSASALNCLADNFAALGRLPEAQRAVEQAIERIESVRRQPTPGDLRSSLLADKHEYYGRLIEILVRRDELEPGKGFAERAFDVAERSRSRTLLDEIERARRERRGDADPKLLARSEALAQEIAQGEETLLTEARSVGAGRDAETRRRLDALRAERDLVEGQIDAASPSGNLGEVASPAGLATVQADLLSSGDTALVELYLGEHASVVWVVRADSMVVERLPPRRVIERLARRASALMAESHDRHKRVQARLAAEALSAEIITPILPALTAPHLAIVADGALNTVSFAALPLAANAESPLLGERFELTRLPSASVGVALRHREPIRSPRGRLAVVADPVFEPDDPRWPGRDPSAPPRLSALRGAGEPGSLRSLTRAAGLDRMPRLEASGREARAIARLVAPDQRKLLLGLDADRREILHGAVSGYRVVHFATHGLVLGKLSGLVLSQVDRRGRPIDGLLRSWEVFDLGLRADLVVLSACRTGRGHYLAGEGVMGLSRAFLAAGSSQVLVSLWDVDDRATAALMERFYQAHLVDGLPFSMALRRAQDWVRSRPEWSAPHYWAGFVLQGAPR